MVRFFFGIGIFVIAIASLAFWAVSAADSDLEQPDSKEKPAYWDGIYTVCPWPQPNEHNTTTNIPHETDCTKFYKCFLGKGVLQTCPLMNEGDPVTRLHYNRVLQVCDWPWQAGCSSCPVQYRNGTYPALSRISHESNNCNYYYECSYGTSTKRTCPSGCFSRTCQECVYNREGGRCPGGSPPWTPTYPPSTPPTPTPIGCITGDRKRHECDCAKYYICHDYTDWIVFQCASGFHFSPTRKECVPPNEAGCWFLTPNEKE